MTKVRGHNYQVEKVSLVNNRDMLQEAMAFRKSIAAGEVKAAAEEHGKQLPRVFTTG
jgi:hypothetical protein